jgi:hypothetical protein
MVKASTPVYIIGRVTAVTRREVTIRAKDRHDKLRDTKLDTAHCSALNLSVDEQPIQVPQWWAHQNKIPFTQQPREQQNES